MSARIVKNVQTLPIFKNAQTVALYKAIGGEVDLELLFQICWKQGKRTAVPVFDAVRKQYDLAEVSAETIYRTGHYGIQESCSPTFLKRDDIDLMIVPGVAFSANGMRLGRGGGYYDRLLDGFGGQTAAVAFDFQILAEVPTELHDQSIETIVTETKILKL